MDIEKVGKYLDHFFFSNVLIFLYAIYLKSSTYVVASTRKSTHVTLKGETEHQSARIYNIKQPSTQNSVQSQCISPEASTQTVPAHDQTRQPQSNHNSEQSSVNEAQTIHPMHPLPSTARSNPTVTPSTHLQPPLESRPTNLPHARASRRQ